MISRHGRGKENIQLGRGGGRELSCADEETGAFIGKHDDNDAFKDEQLGFILAHWHQTLNQGWYEGGEAVRSLTFVTMGKNESSAQPQAN